MDRLDVRILRVLYQGQPVFPLRPGVRLPYRVIGRQLGIAESTIRERIRKLFASRVLHGFSVLVNPTLLGMRMGAFGIDLPPQLQKKDALRALLSTEGVYAVQNHHGRFVGILFECDAKRVPQSLEILRRACKSKGGLFGQFRFPPCPARLDARDWRLVSLLVAGEFTSYRHLSESAGIAVRTLKRRLTYLVNSMVVFSVPRVSLASVREGIPADLIVTYRERERAEPRVLREVDDFAFYAGTGLDGYGLYDLVLPNAMEGTSIRERVASIEGVEQARLEFVDDHLDRPEVFAEFVKQRVDALVSGTKS